MINSAALVGIAATPPGFGALIERFRLARRLPHHGSRNRGSGPGLDRLCPGAARRYPAVEDASVQDRLAAAPGAWHALLQHRSLMLLTVVYGAIGYFQYMFFYSVVSRFTCTDSYNRSLKSARAHV